MNVIKTALDGVAIIEPRIFEDFRGCFIESVISMPKERKLLV